MFFKMIGEKENETTVWRSLNNNKKEVRLEVIDERREESEGGERIQWNLLVLLKIARKRNVNFNHQREKDLFQVSSFHKMK